MFKTFITLFIFCFASYSYSCEKIQTDILFVLFDAGETNGLMPVLKKLEEEKKDFRVLVMATAEKLIPPTQFSGKRLTLIDLGIKEIIDSQTARTIELSATSIDQLFKQLHPKKVLVGIAARIQQQALKCFPNATKIAFVDNFNYDPAQENFAICKDVQSVAQHVLCPSINVVEQFYSDPSQIYHVVGKPSLEQWEKDILNADKRNSYSLSGLDPQEGPIVTFIGGYGPDYEIINPLYETCAARLRKEGYQVFIQPHPKVATSKIKTTDLLAISDFVVGYNSSVIFEAALLGLNAVYLIPTEITFEHFAIKKGFLTSVADEVELLDYIRSGKKPADLKRLLNIPQNSTETIFNIII